MTKHRVFFFALLFLSFRSSTGDRVEIVACEKCSKHGGDASVDPVHDPSLLHRAHVGCGSHVARRDRQLHTSRRAAAGQLELIYARHGPGSNHAADFRLRADSHNFGRKPSGGVGRCCAER